MSTYDAGDARLKVIPDVSGFKKKLEADMSKVRAEFAIDVTANTAQARADIERFRAVEQRNGVQLGVDVELARARAKMDEFRIRQQANAINLRVDVDSSPLQNALSRISQGGGVESGGGAGGPLGLAALATLGVGSLPAVASAAANVVAVVQQLASSGLVLPGVIGGIASSAITAKVGFTGMSDAIDAVNKASDGTPKSIEAAKNALKGLAPAAADVVKTITEIKPVWDKAVRDTFQQNMFDGIAPAFKQSFDEVFPVVQEGLGKISTSWNGTFKGCSARSVLTRRRASSSASSVTPRTRRTSRISRSRRSPMRSARSPRRAANRCRASPTTSSRLLSGSTTGLRRRPPTAGSMTGSTTASPG